MTNALGFVSLAAGDHTDMVDARIVCKTGIDLILEAAASSRSVYMHIINRGSTTTFGETNDVKVKLGLIQK